MQEKKSLNIAIGNRIRISRERAGLTQEQLAEHVNRSTQFISTIERGVAGPSLETIVNLCDILTVSSDWLLRGVECTSDATYIASRISVLSPAQLSVVNRLTDQLLELLQITNAIETR